METTIKDSGNRTEFSTGAVRDIQEDKGRCDLLPLDVVADLMEMNGENASYVLTFRHIERYKETKDEMYLEHSIIIFCEAEDISLVDMLLEVSIHYRDGARKYGENNWQKGLPVKSYLSSGCRHLLKHIDGQKDEAHNRGFVWNILCALWTIRHMPDLIDAPFETVQEQDTNKDEMVSGAMTEFFEKRNESNV